MWLSSIVRNRAIDAWRRAAVRPVETPVVEDGPGQLHTAIGADTPAPERAVVLSLIAELPAPQKEAVFLAYFGGMTHDEIADLVARAARDGQGPHPDGPAEDPRTGSKSSRASATPRARVAELAGRRAGAPRAARRVTPARGRSASPAGVRLSHIRAPFVTNAC